MLNGGWWHAPRVPRGPSQTELLSRNVALLPLTPFFLRTDYRVLLFGGNDSTSKFPV